MLAALQHIGLLEELPELSVGHLTFTPAADVWLDPVKTGQNGEVFLRFLVQFLTVLGHEEYKGAE